AAGHFLGLLAGRPDRLGAATSRGGAAAAIVAVVVTMEQIAEAAEQATAAAIVAGRAAGAFTLVAAVEPSFEPCETAFALAAGIARVVAGVMGTAATHVVAAAVTALAAPVEEATPAAFVTARATAAATRPD